jgi:hypothetical protein
MFSFINTHHALSGLAVQIRSYQGRRFACPWLLHFAPLALFYSGFDAFHTLSHVGGIPLVASINAHFYHTPAEQLQIKTGPVTKDQDTTDAKSMAFRSQI